MKNTILITLLCILRLPSLFAFDLDVDHWTDYSGNLEGKAISVSLYRFSNNQIRGHYYFIGTDSKIYLAGKIKGNEITVWEIINKQPQAMLKGQFFTDSIDKFEGLWFKHNRKIPFKLNVNTIVGGSYGDRYAFLKGTTAQVEQFAKQVKLAIILGDKKWLSLNVSYPIKTSLNGKKQIIIRSMSQFIEQYDRIFYSGFVDKAKKFEYFDLFSNYLGVMMGNGEIWINSIDEKGTNKYKMKITAINN